MHGVSFYIYLPQSAFLKHAAVSAFNLSQVKSGAAHPEERQRMKVSPGLDRGLEVIVDRNFHK